MDIHLESSRLQTSSRKPRTELRRNENNVANQPNDPHHKYHLSEQTTVCHEMQHSVVARCGATKPVRAVSGAVSVQEQHSLIPSQRWCESTQDPEVWDVLHTAKDRSHAAMIG